MERCQKKDKGKPLFVAFINNATKFIVSVAFCNRCIGLSSCLCFCALLVSYNTLYDTNRAVLVSIPALLWTLTMGHNRPRCHCVGKFQIMVKDINKQYTKRCKSICNVTVGSFIHRWIRVVFR